MRLFFALFRKKMPNGNIYRGKDRLSRPVTISDVNKLRTKFEIEEQNMFYLRHPYMTPEQSSGHAKALGKNEESYLKTICRKEKKFKENVRIEEMLGHLRYHEKWD